MDATPPTQVVTDEELVEAIVCELGRYGLNDPRGIEHRPILLSIYARDEVRRSIERVRQKEQLSLQHRIRFRIIARQYDRGGQKRLRFRCTTASARHGSVATPTDCMKREPHGAGRECPA